MSTESSHLLQSKQTLASAIDLLLTDASSSEITDYRSLYIASGLESGEFANKLAEIFSLERTTFEMANAGMSLCEKFSTRFIRTFNFYPYQDNEENKYVAISEPPSSALARAAEMVLGQEITFQIVTFDEISSLLSAHLPEYRQDKDPQPTAQLAEDIENLRDLASGAPVVRAVNNLLEKAIEIGATDLHLEPMRDAMTVRYRVDGMLRRQASLPNAMASAIVSRIKILSGLNIAERRLPQDGSLRTTLNSRLTDMRIAILPTPLGESVVIRFLPVDRSMLDVSRLGVSNNQETQLRRLISMPHGLIVITGPTGSGKTTTLAASLTTINSPARKILTIEDPIEYELPGIVQAQTAPTIGFTFAAALRSFLRLDPDVIMVGEIRDSDTANVAVQAALTGHLVLSTLHTNSATAAIPRLIDLGVQDFLLQSTLRGVVAQRLIRRLCSHCKSSFRVASGLIETDPRITSLGFTEGTRLYRANGCERCGQTGYHGRIGIFEILEIEPTLLQMIKRYEDNESIQQIAIENGFEPLIAHASHAVRKGETDIDEVMRIVSV